MKEHITRFLMAVGLPCFISVTNAQVDKAITLILEKLQQNPPEKIIHPAFQKR
jgi:hypothetical protein